MPYERGAMALHSLITGDKRSMKRIDQMAMKSLGIVHIFTPSGIHLSFLYLLKFLPLSAQFLCLVGLLLFFFTLSGFYPIKRVLIFMLIKKLSPKTSNEVVFGATFVIDILIGQYAHSPLSSTLSFLFWGTIIFYRPWDYMPLISKLTINQILVSFLLKSQLNLFFILINPLLTLIIGPIFLVMMLCYFVLPIWDLPASWWSYLFEQLFKLFEVFSEPLFKLTLPGLLVLSMALMKIKRPSLWMACLLLIPQSIDQRLEYKVRSTKYLSPIELICE